MKVCSKCETRKPEEAFARRVRTGRRATRDSACKECVNRRERERRASNERVTYLPVAPFRAWLEERLPTYDSSEDFAFALGTTERRIWEWRHRSQKVSLEVVDRVLTHEGTTMLDDLYPFDQ